jgi:hypothetical protein
MGRGRRCRRREITDCSVAAGGRSRWPHLVPVVFSDVLFRSLRCVVDGMHLMVGRQMRLIRRCHKIFQLVKLGGHAMVSRSVLVVFGGALMEIAQQ